MMDALLDDLFARAKSIYPEEFGYDPEHDYSIPEGLPKETDFKALQRKYKCVFPPSFIAYQTAYAAHLPMGDFDSEGFGWATKGIKAYRSLADKLDSAKDMEVPETLVPFRDDNGDLFCFDTEQAGEDGECPVVIWDHTSGEVVDDPACTWPNFAAWLESGIKDPERTGEIVEEEETTPPPPSTTKAKPASGISRPGDAAALKRVIDRIVALRESATHEKTPLFPIDTEKGAGFIDSQGKIAIKPQFDDAGDFHEGLAAVKIHGLTGYIDPAGKMVIQPAYVGELRPFAEGRVAVCQKQNKKWMVGYLDRNGKTVVGLKYLFGGDFAEGLAVVKTESKRFACIASDGEELFVLDPSIVCARNFHDGLAEVEVKAKKLTAGFIDMSGQIVIPPEFANASDFSEGLAPVMVGKSGWGYIDTFGTMKIQPTYEWAGNFSGGVAAVKLPVQNGITLIDRDGNIVAQTDCEIIKEFSEGLAAASVHGKGKGAGLVTGYINSAGEMVIPPKYMEAEPFRNGLAQVIFNDMRSAYIDTVGKIVWKEK